MFNSLFGYNNKERTKFCTTSPLLLIHVPITKDQKCGNRFLYFDDNMNSRRHPHPQPTEVEEYLVFFFVDFFHTFWPPHSMSNLSRHSYPTHHHHHHHHHYHYQDRRGGPRYYLGRLEILRMAFTYILTGLKLENYYFFTFLLFLDLKLENYYFFTFLLFLDLKLENYYFFTFLLFLDLKLENYSVFTFLLFLDLKLEYYSVFTFLLFLDLKLEKSREKGREKVKKE